MTTTDSGPNQPRARPNIFERGFERAKAMFYQPPNFSDDIAEVEQTRDAQHRAYELALADSAQGIPGAEEEAATAKRKRDDAQAHIDKLKDTQRGLARRRAEQEAREREALRRARNQELRAVGKERDLAGDELADAIANYVAKHTAFHGKNSRWKELISANPDAGRNVSLGDISQMITVEITKLSPIWPGSNVELRNSPPGGEPAMGGISNLADVRPLKELLRGETAFISERLDAADAEHGS